jgi:adenine-specific DNA-methyltransferase
MDKLEMKTPNLADDNFATLAELFPNAVTETIDENGAIVRAIDADVLAQEINTHVVEGREERYQFTWPDKKKSVLIANAPIAAALRPCREESVDFDVTENLYIEGDNLDVLKLLRETYLGRVKMIYIDPPYNTGNDFVYEDDFSEDVGTFLVRDGQYDDEGNRMVKNLDSNGRFHTDWLNMIYPRLRVARDLLTEDGVLFISIDDNEVTQIRKVCDDVFGEVNFFAQVIIQSNKRGQTYKQIAKTHEYLLIYTKHIDVEFNELEKSGESDDLNLQDNISRHNIRELRNRNPKFGKHNRPNLFYPIFVNPTIQDADGFSPISLVKDESFCVEIVPLNSMGQESCWRWGKDKVKKNSNANTKVSNLVAKAKNDGGYNIYEKYRKTTYKPKSIWDDTAVITEKGTVELGELGLAAYFDFPKPLELLKRAVFIGSNDSDIILDFFSGSATTAHAVMQLNAEDGGKRKFILVQLPEATDEKSEAYKAGYKNICEIGKERIRRAGQKIKAGNAQATIGGGNIAGLDIGFRVLKLDSSNMKDVYYTPQEYTQPQFTFDGLVDNIKEGRTAEDLLFGAMLDLGIPLSSKIEAKTIEGKTVYSVNDGYLLACFVGVTDALVTEVAKSTPYYAVFRDSSFVSDSTLVNYEQIFRTYSPTTQRRVL